MNFEQFKNDIQEVHDTCNSRHHRWSESQRNELFQYHLNNPAVQQAYEEHDVHRSEFCKVYYQSYLDWAKTQQVLGKHMHDTGIPETWAKCDAKRRYFKAMNEYPDTVVLLSMGKFLEAFHSSADVLHKVFKAPYMRGHVAHTGIVASKLDEYLKRLREEGYSNVRLI